MASKALHPLVTLVALSLLISFIHLPTTRAIHLVHERRAIPSAEDAFQTNEAGNQGETMEMVDSDFFRRRVYFEINRDYPGSGANNRHTPNPPVKD